MPIAGMLAAERVNSARNRQPTTDERIRVNVGIIIVVDEVVADSLPENEPCYCNEKNADQGAGNVTEANFTDAYRSCHCLKIQSQTARRLKRYYTVRVFICEFARTNLAHAKAPHSVTFVKELPKTATGKIQKYILRAQRPAIAPQ